MLHRSAWRTLGTSAHLLVHSPDRNDLAPARAACERVVAEVDRSLSRFRPDSELATVNAAAPRWTLVSPLFVQALDLAIGAARWTNGAVDPTVGRAMRVIGYDDDFERLGAARRTVTLSVAPAAGWQVIDLDRGRRAVRVPRGVELDLGATGKALAADLAAGAALDAIGRSASVGVLVGLGGDIATAGRPPDGGWRILVAEDSTVPPDGEGEVIPLEHGAVATSSTTVRRWTRADGTVAHHLVDPSTGSSVVSPWRTVSVVADRCADANAAATATIVLGPGGQDWMQRGGFPARLVATDGSVLRLGGWPEPDAVPVPASAPTALDALSAHG